MKWESKHEEFLVDAGACLLTLVTTVIAVIKGVTLSTLAGTPLEPFLISTAATTSLSLFASRSWRVPAILILFLAAFSVHLYPVTHNVIAGAFYLTSFYLILTDKRLNFYALGIAASIISSTFGLLWFEVTANLAVIGFHLHYAILRYNLK